MRDLDESFALLLGRQPSDAEQKVLYRVRDALELDNNDALWLILMALQYYQGQYQKFPKAIAQSAQAILADFRVTADAIAEASAQEAKAAMTEVVATSTHEVVNKVAGKVKLQWMAACFIVVTVCLCGTGWLAYQAGAEAGWGQGYQQLIVAEEAAEWSFTEEGLLAYELAQVGAGNIKNLAGCKGDGWHREKYKDGFVCWPRKEEKGKQPVGWWVP